MIFDKTKAMRNAEKYVSQGKIRSAIGEYEQVVKHDAKDFGTMNMLGDLYTKSTDIKAAIKCYTSVADHYGMQGFAQKAIAVYNKISKLEPHSIEVSKKLAELYKMKGSLKEARAQYTRLADHFQGEGRKIEALAMWKEIALLDSSNTEVYLSLADSYIAEGQRDEAFDAYTEAGSRFAKKGDHENAITSFAKAIEIKRAEPKVLAAFAQSSIALGRAGIAAETLAEILVVNPHSREIRLLLIDCLLEAKNISEAEKAVIKLVEMEPANYPRFLELAHIYVAANDTDSATRILSMSSEHMLVGGQADEYHMLVKQVLDQKPDHLDALRLLARYCSWQRDEEALRQSLIKLAEVARYADSIDDERNALVQLTMIMPQEAAYADRLREINKLHGFEQTDEQENLFDKRFLKDHGFAETMQPVVFGEISAEVHEAVAVNGFTEADTGFAFTGDVTEVVEPDATVIGPDDTAAVAGDDLRFRKEIDSIRFYIENGYTELAAKAVGELRAEFGERPELNGLEGELVALASFAGHETNGSNAPALPNADSLNGTKKFDLDEFRNELGIEEGDSNDNSDYETHFNTAVAYQEMGMVEEAIKEFQEAVSLIKANDGTRRFFSCANLLGYCFIQQNMPNLALKWFQRTLETDGLSEEEKQGIWYELAGAYEADGDFENAGRYFEQVYAENANFRDVSDRVKNIAVNQ